MTKNSPLGNLLTMKASVDKATCIGCAACTAVAGKTFTMDDSGKAQASDPIGDEPTVVKQAAEGCPVKAIQVEE